jgi:hypothetical protein
LESIRVKEIKKSIIFKLNKLGNLQEFLPLVERKKSKKESVLVEGMDFIDPDQILKDFLS